jgi:hypothetical protein
VLQPEALQKSFFCRHCSSDMILMNIYIQYFDLSWSPVLMPLFRPVMTDSDDLE